MLGGGSSNDIALVRHAERVVKSTYGDVVSARAKAKNLNKFGTSAIVGTGWTTVAQFQGSVANETFASTNLIDTVSSSAAGDTSLTITVEGHTIDGSGNLTFTIQNVTTDASDGRTPVALSTPLARATRAYITNSGTFGAPQSEPAGVIHIYDNTDGHSNGIPSTPAATKMVIQAGFTQTEKCATTVSATDYYFVRYFTAVIAQASPQADLVDCRIETRDVFNGGVWRPLGRDFTVFKLVEGLFAQFDPLLIVPKNHDVRVRAKADANTATVHAEIGGYLASVIS